MLADMGSCQMDRVWSTLPEIFLGAIGVHYQRYLGISIMSTPLSQRQVWSPYDESRKGASTATFDTGEVAEDKLTWCIFSQVTPRGRRSERVAQHGTTGVSLVVNGQR
ncbi:hypothetical protein Btru_042558 [Bulinus truncatus]|nr:hypothetical protein Btru_042558 [Bulinus truncatus]